MDSKPLTIWYNGGIRVVIRQASEIFERHYISSEPRKISGCSEGHLITERPSFALTWII